MKKSRNGISPRNTQHTTKATIIKPNVSDRTNKSPRNIRQTKTITKNSMNNSQEDIEDQIVIHEEFEDITKILKARRQDEEKCLDFLAKNQRIAREMSSKRFDNIIKADLWNYFTDRMIRPSEQEQELEKSFSSNFDNKRLFIENRSEREEQYIAQRKIDYSISQKRSEALTKKLQQEFNNDVNNLLEECKECAQQTLEQSQQQISEISAKTTNTIISSAIRTQEIADAVGFVLPCYNQIMSLFNENSEPFDQSNENIPEYQAKTYRLPLKDDTSRVFVTMLEEFQPEIMTPRLISRDIRCICILTKPLVFTQQQCEEIAKSLGWKPVFVESFENAPEEIFKLLSTSERDIMLFGFPRNPSELEDVYALFNPSLDPQEESILPRPKPSIVSPFDLIIELDISDEIILRDALATLEDSETHETFDVRTLALEDEHQITRLRPIADDLLNNPQYPTRSVILRSNFELIHKKHSDIYRKIDLDSHAVTQDLIEQLRSLADSIEAPAPPEYPPDAVLPTLTEQIKEITPELRKFFVEQWQEIDRAYETSVLKVFQLVNSAHLALVEHLQRARREMQAFLGRPGNSQHLVVELQQWHCTQVERCMRRMQKVKDECTLRLTALREQLLLIETDRKAEEETKQKDLLNAPFRMALFEVLANAYTMLAQAEIDRWTATRVLLMDFNQVIIKGELVPPLARKKLNLVLDPSRTDKKKSAKKPSRSTPPSKSRLDGKLPTFDLPLTEAIEGIKKYVADAASIYVPVTAPVSTRAKPRPTKDKNPFAPHKISAIDEFQAAFRDDDAYLVGQLDKICSMAQEEVSVVQQSFDSFVDDSTAWIQGHFERRKAIADTAIAFMQQRVNDEQQLNQLIFFSEDSCTVDYTHLLTANEESPKIPPPFPEDIIHDSLEGSPESLLKKISVFETESQAN